MARRQIIPWFAANDYDAIAGMIAEFPDRGGTFDEWLQAATKRILDLEARGDTVIKAHVDSKQFSIWCRSAGQDRNFASLGAYAVKVAWDKDKGGT